MQIKNDIKTLLSLAFIVLISLQIGLKSYMSVWYLLDNASFEKAYCVNINLPDVMCHGSCLIQELSDTPSDDAQVPSTMKLFKGVEYILPVVNFEIEDFELTSTQSSVFPMDEFTYQSPFIGGLLRPPCS